MNLDFDRLVVQNFKSLTDIDLDLKSRGPGLHFLRGQNLVEPELGSNDCFFGGTLIDCPRDLIKYPRGIPIKELVGKQFLTYSWDEKADTLVLSKVKRVWRVGFEKIYKVSLTAYPNGRKFVGNRKGGKQQGRFLPPSELIGTYNQRVMLCDGTWKKLGELSPGDSLKSLYRRDTNDRGKISWSSQVRKQQKNVGWQKNVKNPFTYYGLTTAKREQLFVCGAINGPKPKGAHSHHIDENKYNHTPSNLIWKDAHTHLSEHTSERNKQGTAGWKVSGIHPQGMSGKKHTKTVKNRISTTLKRQWAERRKGAVPNHKVISIEPLGVDDVYDMEVEGTHNFVANGVFVHNSGKTSLWGALAWCLFGRTVDGLKGVDVHPWGDPKAHTMVAVHLRIDSKKHFIGRALNPNWTQLDGKDCGQEHIDNLLQLSFDVFRHTILLGQAQPLFFDLSPHDKMELFTAVLDLDRWEERSDRANDITDDFLAQKQKLTTELATLQASLDEVQHLVKDTKAKSDEWEGSRMKRVKDDKATLKECLAQLDRKKVEYGKWDLQYESASIELKACNALIDKLHQQSRGAQLDAARAEHLTEELKVLNAAKTCPTCGQPIAKKNLASHKAELEAEIQKIMPAVETIAKLAVKIASASNDVIGFRQHVDQSWREIELALPTISRLEAEIKLLRVKISGTDAERNPHRDLIEDLKARERDLKLDCADVISEITDVTTKIDRTKPWIKGFKEVRLYIIEELLQELELVINFMLKELGLVDWKVQFEIEKETKSGKTNPGLNTVILSPRNKTPVKWEVWGGGVGQRLRVLSALALSEVLLNRAGVTPNLEILDEPTKGLSEIGVNGLVELLSGRAFALSKQIWFVDHHVVESSQFASVLTVTKDKEGSCLS